MGALYLALIVGALTTLYPFLVMLMTGFKGPTDQDDNQLVPAFWSDTNQLEEKYLYDKYAGDISRIDSTRVGGEASQEDVERYREMLESLSPMDWQAGFRNPPNNITSRLTQRWQAWLREKWDDDIDQLNAAYSELNLAFQTVSAPNEVLDREGWVPAEGNKWSDWLEFKNGLPAEYRVPIRTQRIMQEALRSEYQGQISEVPSELRGDAEFFEQIELNETTLAYIQANVARDLNTTIEFLWDPTLSTAPPIEAFERDHLAVNKTAVATEMSTRNYRYVIDYMLLHGIALRNTVIFCLLAILAQLTVNPLAAYALSRFPMKATARVLVFLLATMAFPAEVAMIPSFLLLKHLGLLNTFAALVLPTAANGYMIFLLKGFFDSLPREVFESGQIDGAKESTMMMKLAFPLSKPVMGYLGLLAFMGAYGAFLYAFLVAQDQKVWTIMVFIYQLQQIAPKSVMMAAITLAAIPSILVFLAAQRVIMRGIVLPSER